MPPANTTKKLHKPRRYLPDDYEPHVNDVLIGRGRRVETHNKKFRAMISAHLAAYYNAQTKATKSTIILRIFQQVKRGGGTGFVKQEASSRRWFVIEDAAARISIAQAFRDALSSEYKSSKQYKQQKRKEERGELPTVTGLGHMMMTNSMIPCDAPSFVRQISGEQQQQQIPTLPTLLPPRLVPVVSSDGRDLTAASLQAILERANSVVNSIDAESLLRNGAAAAAAVSHVPEAASSLNLQDDLFAGLEQAFGTNVDLTSDPFEPTPLREEEPAQIGSANDLLFGDGDADLMDAIVSQQRVLVKPAAEEDEDVFKVFDSVPAHDMRHALSA